MTCGEWGRLKGKGWRRRLLAFLMDYYQMTTEGHRKNPDSKWPGRSNGDHELLKTNQKGNILSLQAAIYYGITNALHTCKDNKKYVSVKQECQIKNKVTCKINPHP